MHNSVVDNLWNSARRILRYVGALGVFGLAASCNFDPSAQTPSNETDARGEIADAGRAIDAAQPVDANQAIDAAQPVDANQAIDAAMKPDAAMKLDAAAMKLDAATTGDAGGPIP